MKKARGGEATNPAPAISAVTPVWRRARGSVVERGKFNGCVMSHKRDFVLEFARPTSGKRIAVPASGACAYVAARWRAVIPVKCAHCKKTHQFCFKVQKDTSDLLPGRLYQWKPRHRRANYSCRDCAPTASAWKGGEEKTGTLESPGALTRVGSSKKA